MKMAINRSQQPIKMLQMTNAFILIHTKDRESTEIGLIDFQYPSGGCRRLSLFQVNVKYQIC